MSRGGPRPGAGRPKGSKNVDSRMIRKAKQEGIDIEGTSLGYLQRVYRGQIKSPDPKRIEAARAAAPFEFPRLTDATLTHKNPLDGKSDEEFKELLRASIVNVFTDPDWRDFLKTQAREQLGMIETPGNVVPLQKPAAA